MNLIRKYWFFFVIGAMVIIFVFNREIAIWITIGLLFFFTIYYIPTLTLKNKIIRQIKEHYRLTDTEISEKLRRSLDEIRDKMFVLLKNQKKKKWLIVFLNERYISYDKNTVEEFIELYIKGLNDKEIHENLKKHIPIRTRAEIKAIENTMSKQHRLVKRNHLEEKTRNKIQKSK